MTLEASIRELHAKGYSYNKIKEELGCSKGTISYYMGDGQREKTRARTRDSRNNIRKYIQEYKQSNVCTDCKENYPYWIMEFDHIGEDKSFTIGQFQDITSDLEKIKEEIAKCEVVCGNCHRNRTHMRRTAIAHDTMNLTEVYE